MPNASALAPAAAAATGILVGVATVATKSLVDQTGPASLALLRYSVGLLCLLPPTLLSERPASKLRAHAERPVRALGIRACRVGRRRLAAVRPGLPGHALARTRARRARRPSRAFLAGLVHGARGAPTLALCAANRRPRLPPIGTARGTGIVWPPGSASRECTPRGDHGARGAGSGRGRARRGVRGGIGAAPAMLVST